MADSISNAVPASPNGQDDRGDQRPDSSKAPRGADKPNWYDDPEFRKTQAKLQQQINEANQRATLVQQQLEQERQARIRLEEANMDETERALRQVERERQEKLQWQQYAASLAQAKEEEEQKRKALERVAKKFEVSVDELWEAKDAIEAAEIAHTKWIERREREGEQQQQRRAANRTDLMTGRPPQNFGDNQFQDKLNEARRQGDGKGFWDIMWEANKAGVELK